MTPEILKWGLDDVYHGGFRITRSRTPVPANCRLLLRPVGTRSDWVDVTGFQPGDLVTPANLPLVLLMFSKRGWPSNLSVQLALVRDGRDIAVSLPVMLPGPVEPHHGPLLPLPARCRSTYRYLFKTGPGGKDPDGHGRTLCEVVGFPGSYFFIEKGRFETNPRHRGFGCILYAGAVCGLQAKDWRGLEKEVDEHPKNDTDALTTFDLATRLNARIVLARRPRDEVLRYFDSHPPGYHLVWSGGHVVVVFDNVVYEFNRWKENDIDGYAETPVHQRLGWYLATKLLTVALLPSKPLLAG